MWCVWFFTAGLYLRFFYVHADDINKKTSGLSHDKPPILLTSDYINVQG